MCADEKEIENISEFFPKEEPPERELTPGQKWEVIFEAWIDKIDQKKLMPDLLELKFWFEGLEEFFSSTYLEDLVFKYQHAESRNYQVYVVIFAQVVGKIINHLKTLDFDKDKFFLNFEEFILDKFLENYSPKSFPYIKDVYSTESWFYSLRIFLQNFRNITIDLAKSDIISQKTFFSLKRLYRKEVMDNSIVLSLLKGNFVPRMDKIHQLDICDIIASIEDKKLKKDIGIFFILAYRILKINNFIDANLNKNKSIDLTIPLIMALKRNLDNFAAFIESSLKPSFQTSMANDEINQHLENAFISFGYEYKKIFSAELPYFFDVRDERINKRKILKNIAIIADFAIQYLIEEVAKIFKPALTTARLFGEFSSRDEMIAEARKKLEKLYTKINNYMARKGEITSADIFFDINLFMEAELIYLQYKDWDNFLKYYSELVSSDFTPEFRNILRNFQSFIADILKEIAKSLLKKQM